MNRKTMVLFVVAAYFFGGLASAEEGKKGFFDFIRKKDEAAILAASEKSSGVAAEPVADVTDSELPDEKSIPAASETVTQAKPDNMGAALQRLANNNSLSDADKKSLAELAVRAAPPGANLKDSAYEKTMLLFEQIGNDPNMKVDEKKAALQANMDASFKELPVVSRESDVVSSAAKPVDSGDVKTVTADGADSATEQKKVGIAPLSTTPTKDVNHKRAGL